MATSHRASPLPIHIQRVKKIINNDNYTKVRLETEMKYLYDALDDYTEKIIELENTIQEKINAIGEMTFTVLEIARTLQQANSALQNALQDNGMLREQVQMEESILKRY